MKIAVIGAGVTGLTAALDLARRGHQVSVFEASTRAGGLAAGFADSHWDWPLERFYHHLFEGDAAIRSLVVDIGFADKLFFRQPVTAQWWNGCGYPISGGSTLPVPGALASGLSVLRFPALPLLGRLRLALALGYLKYGIRDWRPLEQETAASWSRRALGPTVHEAFIQPLLEGKFGPYAEEVNMAWLWARFKARSFKLGYFVGGFQAFVDALMEHVRRAGAEIALSVKVGPITPLPGGSWRLAITGPGEGSTASEQEFEAVIFTGSPGLLNKLVPQLPSSYLGRLQQLRSLGAVVLILALQRPLTDGLYWVNMPRDRFPFLALVEHTNFIEPEHYGGDHLIYCGDYLDPAHEYFQLTPEELLQRFIPGLRQVNPRFEPSWVRAYWLQREPYAQPIVTINHSCNIPPLATPLAGLYWASMSHVYPWDRGTNYAVELGHRVADDVRSPGESS